MTFHGQPTTQTAGSLSSLADVARCFAGRRSSRLLAGLTLLAVACRLVVGDWTTVDLLVFVIAAALIGPVEWLVHRLLFHSPSSSFRRRIGFGRDHAAHHDDPDDLDALFLSVGGAIVLVAGLVVFVVSWAMPVTLVAGSSPAPTLVAAATAMAALCHYEWVHLLAHSRYRPHTRYYRRLARNHRLHHFRDERYWLGVTTNSGDRLFRTMKG